MFVFKAAVVGAGTMGGQIAQTIAAAGISVVLKDIDRGSVDAGVAEARRLTASRAAQQVEKGRISEAQAAEHLDEVLGLITATVSYDEFGDVDFVIEAVTEDLEVKRAVFAQLDTVTPGRAILASNTSSLSITEIGDATRRADQVLGFHFFFPATVMPLIEVVEGDETSAETLAAATSFALAIRKQPIRCRDAPGFVVNRILTAGSSEILARQESDGLAVDRIDRGLVERKALPVGPFELDHRLGLDTVLRVHEQMHDAYGERFRVPSQMAALVGAGDLGAKTGRGYYDRDCAPVSGGAEPDIDELVELLQLRSLVEAALCLQDGIATHRDIDFAMIAGAGMDPRKGLLPPFMRADQQGIDDVLARLERAVGRYGRRFEPPTVLRQLAAQGRLGAEAGQGFYPYPRPDERQPGETVLLETRDEIAIAWLAHGQLNSISRQVVADLGAVFQAAREHGARALILASANPLVFSAGADVKELAGSPDAGALIADMHALTRALERSDVVTIAAVNGMALGGGCELAMACDLRLAARSALFGQPEIKLGMIPGFGGTQRLPRLVGGDRALELNLIGEPIVAQDAFEIGLVNRVLIDHELFDAALAWARRATELAPLAVGQIKRVARDPALDAGLAAEAVAFEAVFASKDAREGVSAFLDRRRPRWSGS